MISSCPLPQPSPDPAPGSGPGPQSRDPTSSGGPGGSAAEVGGRRECPEPEYSLPFDTVAPHTQRAGRAPVPGDSGSDPLYDSIDETLIRNIFLSDGGGATCRKVEHIYDEPEGCTAPCLQEDQVSVYDDPEEMKGDAWRLMGAPEAKGHDPPHNPADDYAVPQRQHSTAQEERVEQAENSQDSPYRNITATIKRSSVGKSGQADQ